MKFFYWLFVCAVASAQSPNVTGRWTGPATTADNGLEFVLALNQTDDGNITGYILSRATENILGGTLAGGKLTIAAERPGRGGVLTIQYTAIVDGNKMKLTIPGSGRRPPETIELARVSSTAPGPLPARAAPVSLPKPEPVTANGLAKTPPMGWNSWNKFRNGVSDKVVREIADTMVRNGMRDAGYIYVNIDDTWESAHRDAQGRIGTNNKFPDMKALAAYVHSKGLKLGIYSSPGPKTCASYLGSYQHEEQDAKTYAAWGIDYLKYDWCSASQVYDNTRPTMEAAYAKMGRALLDSGHKIVFSLCQYGLLDVGEWGAYVGGNLWRTTGDISDNWQSMSHIGFDLQMGREKYAGPSHWNDPDMLEVGNGGMNNDEYKTHMSLWCLLAAPLLAGNDVRDMTHETAAILLNKEVLAVDQDKLGKQGVRVAKSGDLEVWSKPLADGGRAVGLFNRGEDTAKVTAKWADLGIDGPHAVRDLWGHRDLGKATGEYSVEVPRHGVVMVKIL